MASSRWTRTDRHVAKRLLSTAGLGFYGLAALALIYSGAGFARFLSASGTKSDLLLPACCLLLAGSHFAIGYHLRRRRIWARNFAFAFALVSLFLVPLGTAFGVLVIACIDSANRAGLFPPRPRALEELASERQDPAVVLDFEPELAAERAG